ncbi:Ubiquitin-like-conjugating enzyme ATG10 [Geodia barretti]|uniref:Ubiquitin-like-conjugating enzyme ATG10 n=1 Tax=Geodia barretti TaxID=519541 RepID=A0AA35U0E1_GEOBA|nr:Ubiquitin-like-conjugating enzyme ATG10 [Geodia barretti]
MATGLLTYEEFVRNARDLVVMSDRLGDGWELRHVRQTDGPEETAFLVKRICVAIAEESPVDPETPRDVGEPENIEDEDPATLHCRGTGKLSEKTVQFEYHVIYSPSYQVPVLFFTATFHSGRLVPLKEIWKFLSPFHVTRDSGMEWESVTQQEHPIFGRPFYHLHPCHTSNVMATILTANKHERGDRDIKNYLLSWLTIFGPTIGLNVLIDYLKIDSKT